MGAVHTQDSALIRKGSRRCMADSSRLSTAAVHQQAPSQSALQAHTSSRLSTQSASCPASATALALALLAPMRPHTCSSLPHSLRTLASNTCMGEGSGNGPSRVSSLGTWEQGRLQAYQPYFTGMNCIKCKTACHQMQGNLQGNERQSIAHTGSQQARTRSGAAAAAPPSPAALLSTARAATADMPSSFWWALSSGCSAWT